ncbi:MAG: transcriptional regulator [Owenweeksia sp.]|nr:transcriptional regulator [Owenweeksia sp.]
MNYLGENIRFLRKQKELTQADLANKLGLNRSLIGAYEEGRSEPRLKTMQALCLLFKTDLEQLVNAGLSAAKSGKKTVDVKGEKLRILPIPVDAEGREGISLIPEKASAGYTQGYGDPEFIEQLAMAQLPFPELPSERTMRIFQIQGDSMLPVLPGSYIIAEYVDNWEHIKSHECYILITRNDGIVYKRVNNNIRENGELLLQSDNTAYSPYTLPVEEVLEVWKARGIVSFELPDPKDYNSSLNHSMLDMMNELKSEMARLREKLN